VLRPRFIPVPVLSWWGLLALLGAGSAYEPITGRGIGPAPLPSDVCVAGAAHLAGLAVGVLAGTLGWRRCREFARETIPFLGSRPNSHTLKVNNALRVPPGGQANAY